MLNYIKADFYRIFRKKSLYTFLVICSLGFIAINFIISGTGYTMDKYLGLTNVLLSFVPIFIGLYVFNAVYTDDLRSKSLQNAIGFGKKRSEIVVVKLLDAIFLLSLFTVLILAHVYLIPSLFGLKLTPDMMTSLNANVLNAFLKTVGYFAITSIAVFFFQKTSSATTVFILLSTGTIHLLLSLLLSQRFIVDMIGNLQPYLFSEIVQSVSVYVQMQTGNIVVLIIVLLSYIIGATLLATFAFNQKELEF